MLYNLHLLRPWWLIALLPLTWILWKLTQVAFRSGAWKDIVDQHLLPHVLIGDQTRSSHGYLYLLTVGGILGIVALAGPAWEKLPQPVYQSQKMRVIVLDLSPTMNATDVVPSRMIQARFKILDLLKSTKEGETALIAYGPEPFLVSPLTTDAATIAAQIPDLDTNLLPVQGPSHADLALSEADALLQQVNAPSGEVLLITDSLDYPAATYNIARRLLNHGYQISVLGVGTEHGAPVPVSSGGFLKDANGAILLPRLQKTALENLAAVGGGRYMTATIDNQDLEAIFSAGMNQETQKLTPQHTLTDQWREEGPMLLLLLLPLAALAFRRGWLGPILLFLLLTPPKSSQAFEWRDLWMRSDQQGASQLAAGHAKEAAEQFQNPNWRAAAQYKAGDYTKALEILQHSNSPDVDYNRGNALAKLGRFKEALSAYEQAIKLNPQDQDAHANLELVRHLLEQQQQQNAQHNTPEQSQTSESSPKTESKSAPPPKAAPNQKSVHSQQDKQDKDPQSAQNTKSSNQDNQDQTAPQHSQTNQDQVKQQDQAKNATDDSKPSLKQQTNPNTKDNSGKLTSKPDKSNSNKPEPADLVDKNLTSSTTVPTPQEQAQQELNQSIDNRLKKVPDDPAGLLRQRFILQHLRRL